jgi:hypothetical protein
MLKCEREKVCESASEAVTGTWPKWHGCVGRVDTRLIFSAVDEEHSTARYKPHAGARGRRGSSDEVGEIDPLKGSWVKAVDVVHERCCAKMRW